MASAIHFLSASGNVLLTRNFRGDIPESCAQLFKTLYPLYEEPCFIHNGICYMYIKHANIFLLAVAKKNLNSMSIFVFLHRLVAALQHYVKDVQEESIRDNHVILYELLDEMMDFGAVQNTDINILQDYVTQTPHQLQALSALTGNIPWRPLGIFYKKNELFVDVIETLHSTLDYDGTVISSVVIGRIAVKAFLSGMPNLKLSFNDYKKSKLAAAVESGAEVSNYRLSKYVNLEDVAFHESVSLDAFETDRSINFIPPDGSFDLLTYRVVPKSQALFTCDTNVDVRGHSRVLITCNMASHYKRRQSVTFVEFTIPVPPDGDSPRFKTSHGTVVYAPESNAMIWRIKEFAGGRTATMKAELLLPSTGPIIKPTAPVQVKFELPSVAYSGLEIRYIKVTEDQLKYSSYPWVRYTTKSGDIEIRRRRPGENTKPEVPEKDAVQPSKAEST